ncbi:hypothetical protein Lfu02_40280 [Longispora fulva]|uniref:Energy-converting hydrogenase Eha subunit A n=1 Tax=Longispora fulva TaxID=619741 RepID=A0A8J7KWF2_9ACTN|nr:hypothetical protein [Longispora fulva]MBG6136487.1 energy-converting hydrogenase Eha subunit A [Longispora fulva]GIG59656.1 hypothetical protein Lfu02_40280 [Longispora fulva]
MQVSDVVSILAAVLVPVVTAAVGALGIVVRDRSQAGRRARAVFYLDLAVMALLLISVLAVALTGESRVPGRTLGYIITMEVADGMVLGFLALGLRLWATSIDRARTPHCGGTS